MIDADVSAFLCLKIIKNPGAYGIKTKKRECSAKYTSIITKNKVKN